MNRYCCQQLIQLALLAAMSALASPGVAATVSLDLREQGPLPKMSYASGESSASESGVVRQHRLGAGAAGITGLRNGDRLDLRLFDDRAFILEITGERQTLSGRAFLGRSGTNGLDCVVLETRDGLTVDVMDSANGMVYQVVSGSDGVIIREAKFRGTCDPDYPITPRRSTGVKPVISIGQAVIAESGDDAVPVADSVATQTETRLKTASSSKPTIDILVAYDTRAATWANSSGGGLEAFAEACVQKMNVAIANTGLDSKFTFRLVGVHEIGASSGSDLYYALYCGSGDKASQDDPEEWETVAEAREECCADIVCVLIDTGSDTGTTGVGYSLTEKLAENGQTADCGCNACAIRAVAAGHTMTHEVGHNMGAGHASTMKDKSNCGPQYYTYSSGYYFTNSAKKAYHTMMAYNFDGYGNTYQPAPYFSSPNYKYDGAYVGNATHDNTRTLENNYLIVSRSLGWVEDASDVGAAIEAGDYIWETSGEYQWTVADGVGTKGGSAARSGDDKCSGRTSSLMTKVKGPATLSFDYQIRTYNGSFVVQCDSDVLFSRLKADVESMPWTAVSSLSIPAGRHVVKFTYTTDGYYSGGWGNGVRLDNVVFNGGAPVLDVSSGCYAVVFSAGDGSGLKSIKECGIGSVCALDGCALTAPTGKSFAGWKCSNGKRYDDKMLIFNLTNEQEYVIMTPIWK